MNAAPSAICASSSRPSTPSTIRYGEIGDFVAEKVLPIYGKAILPELRAKLDLKGQSAGHGRRLRLMHDLDPAGTRELVKQALDDGSKEVKVVAIECLGGDPEDLAYSASSKPPRRPRKCVRRRIGPWPSIDDDAAVAVLAKGADRQGPAIWRPDSLRQKPQCQIARLRHHGGRARNWRNSARSRTRRKSARKSFGSQSLLHCLHRPRRQGDGGVCLEGVRPTGRAGEVQGGYSVGGGSGFASGGRAGEWNAEDANGAGGVARQPESAA